MEPMTRGLTEQSTSLGQRSEHRWEERLDLGDESLVIGYADNGSKRARSPWITYRATGTLAGTAIDVDGPYVAEPNWWHRRQTDLGSGVQASRDGRRSFIIQSNGERFGLAPGTRFRSMLTGQRATLAEFPFGYGRFDVARDQLDSTSALVLACVVGSGIYRMTAWARLLDGGLLNTASPFRKRAHRHDSYGSATNH